MRNRIAELRLIGDRSEGTRAIAQIVKLLAQLTVRHWIQLPPDQRQGLRAIWRRKVRARPLIRE